ncbi:MAG: hypothetical protein AB7I45_01480 [Planctomycetota bacterium]
MEQSKDDDLARAEARRQRMLVDPDGHGFTEEEWQEVQEGLLHLLQEMMGATPEIEIVGDRVAYTFRRKS